MDTAVLRQSITRLSQQYGSHLVEVAAMVYVSRRAVGLCARERGVGAEGILGTLDKCVESHLIEHDLHPVMLARIIDEIDHDLVPEPLDTGPRMGEHCRC